MARQLEDSRWKKDAKGREVVQAWVSTHFQSFKVGDVCEVAGREFTVEAIGEPFKIGGKGDKFVYLYPTAPVTTRRQAEEFKDEDVAAFEESARQITASESAREIG